MGPQSLAWEDSSVAPGFFPVSSTWGSGRLDAESRPYNYLNYSGHAAISGGIAVRTMSTNPSDNPVIIENNTITVYPPVPRQPPPVTGRGFAVWMRDNGCPMKILGNTLSGGVSEHMCIPTRGDVIISGNTINSRVYGMYVMQNTRECIVTDNTVNGYSRRARRFMFVQHRVTESIDISQ